ncbi:MAG: hypothetical protein ACE5KY_03120 [Candidatus Tectimicrobiota bacterium]
MGEGLKSAYEKAMERLKEKGMEPAETALTDEQKHEITEIRKKCEAKRAEFDIMMQSAIKKALAKGEGSEQVEEIEARYAAEKASLLDEMEQRVAAVRQRSKENG